MVWPDPRYPAPILMNPDAFRWIKASPATSRKVLGRFTETDIAISMLRWDAQGDTTMGPERTQLLFSLGGEIVVAGDSYGAQTAVWSDLGESAGVIGTPGTTAVLFEFPLVLAEADNQMTSSTRLPAGASTELV